MKVGAAQNIKISADEPQSAKQDKPYAKLEDAQDEVSLQSKSAEKPKRGFSVFNAAGRFLQGSITDTINNICSVGGAIGIGLGVAAARIFGKPAVAIMGAWGLAAGAFMLVKGSLQAINRHNKGDNEGAENAFRTIGSGTTASALSFFGLRGLKIGGKQIFEGYKGHATSTTANVGSETVTTTKTSIGVRGAFRDVWSIFKGRDVAAGETILNNMAQAGENIATASKAMGLRPGEAIRVPTSEQLQAGATAITNGLKSSVKDGSVAFAASDLIINDHAKTEYLKDKLNSL